MYKLNLAIILICFFFSGLVFAEPVTGPGGPIEPAHDPAANTDSVAECGTAHGKTYSLTSPGYGNDSFCKQGAYGNPYSLSPLFPSAGQTITWNCWANLATVTTECSASRAGDESKILVGSCNHFDKSTAAQLQEHQLCESGKSSDFSFTEDRGIVTSTSWTCFDDYPGVPNYVGGGSSTCSSTSAGTRGGRACGDANQTALDSPLEASVTSFDGMNLCTSTSRDSYSPFVSLGLNDSDVQFPEPGETVNWYCADESQDDIEVCQMSREHSDVVALSGIEITSVISGAVFEPVNVPSKTPVILRAGIDEGAEIKNVHFRWTINDEVVSERFGSAGAAIAYEFQQPVTEVIVEVIRDKQSVSVKKIVAKYPAFAIEEIEVIDRFAVVSGSNGVPVDYPLDQVPYDKEVVVHITNDQEALNDVNFTWYVNDVEVEKGLGRDYSFIEIQGGKGEWKELSAKIKVVTQREGETPVEKEVVITGLSVGLSSFVDHPAVGEGITLAAIDGSFEQGVDIIGTYYTPTSNSLSIYETLNNEVIVNISLNDPSKVKIYTRKIISLDPTARITFTDKDLPLFEGKFNIEKEVLRNNLVVESIAQEAFSDLDKEAQCERIYGESSDASKKTKCLETSESDDRILLTISNELAKSYTPVTDATLTMGTESDDVGLSAALMATPYLWDAQLDLNKRKVKLTALVSPMSVFNLDGNDYSLIELGSEALTGPMLLTAKGLNTLPFTYTMESDGSTKTEIGKSNLQFPSILLELNDSKSISWESELESDPESKNGYTRKNTIKIKKAVARTSYEASDTKKHSNIAFDIVNAKLEYIDNQYQLKSYEAGTSLNIPEIPLWAGSKIKNASLGIYFVGRSSLDDEDWPVAFTDEHLKSSRFYMYLAGSGELIAKIKGYQNSLDVKFKVIPGPIAHYENYLMLSASIDYERNAIQSLRPWSSSKFEITDIRGALKYLPELDDFAWKVGAGAWVGKYHGIGSFLFKLGDPLNGDLTFGAVVDSLSLRKSNKTQLKLGQACLLGGKLTPSLVEFAKCPKFTNSCSTSEVLQEDAIIANGVLIRLKADLEYQTRKDGSKDWKSEIGPGVADLELGYKVIVDEQVKSGEEEGTYVSGGGAGSLKIPASKSKFFPFPSKDLALLNVCLGYSPFDLTYYYEEGFFSDVEKVQNIKNLHGLYAKSSSIFSNKEMSVFISFEPFQLADEDEERVYLVGSDFTIDLRDNILGRSTNASSKIVANREVNDGVVKETLSVPSGDSGPIVVIENVSSVTVTAPSGLVLTEVDVSGYDFIDIVKGNTNVNVSLNNPEGGEWVFEFDDVAGNDFTVLTQNKPPVASAGLVSSQVVYDAPLVVQLDYLDSDSDRGFVKLVAKQGDQQSTLYEGEIDLTNSLEDIEVQLPKPGSYELVLQYTDGMRGYIDASLGTVESTLPEIQVSNLSVKATPDNVVAEWVSDEIIQDFEVLIINSESGVTDRFDTLEPTFSLAGLIASDYTIQVNALFDSQVVASSNKDFTISEVAGCSPQVAFSISKDFSDGYTLVFNQDDAQYFDLTIQSKTINHKKVSEKLITPSYDISSFVGNYVDITVRAVDQCGNELTETNSLLVSNELDLDNDGLFDDWELTFFGSLVQSGTNDFDQDDVSNTDELALYLNPSKWDSDGDKIADNDDPSPLSYRDVNANSLPDDWESFYQISSLAGDPDGDNLTNYDEYFVNGNPNVFDADLQVPDVGLGPVIQTDRDQSHIISVALSETINVDASNSIDSAKGSLNYSWYFNDKSFSTAATIAYTPDIEGWGNLRLSVKNTDGVASSRSWAVLVSSSAIDTRELTLGTVNEVINYSGLQFSFPDTLHAGSLFIGELLTSDLPELPDGYKLVGEGGLMLSFNGGSSLSEQISITHVSSDILMMYSAQKSAWVEVAGEGRSVKTDKLGIFALFAKDDVETISTSDTDIPANNSSGSCFIATAAFGSYLQDEVQILRDFRDNYLLTNSLGTQFVKVYYELSPPIAELIVQQDAARLFVRAILSVIIFVFQYFSELMLLLLLAYSLRVYLFQDVRHIYIIR